MKAVGVKITKMKIETIIYETTRNLQNIEDKLRIATIFLFCHKLNAQAFADLLYAKNHELNIKYLNEEFKSYGVDFNIRLNDRNIRDAFFKTLEKVKEKYDDDGYYKALHEGDDFAVVIAEIMNYNFSEAMILKHVKQASEQLKLNF